MICGRSVSKMIVFIGTTWDDNIFNVVNFENLIYMELYNLLILTENTKKSKNNFKHRKRVKWLYFQVVYCHVNKTSQQYTTLYTTYSHVLEGKIKAIAANWCLIVRTQGGHTCSTDGLLNVGPTASPCGPMLC